MDAYVAASVDGLDLLVHLVHQLLVLLVGQEGEGACVDACTARAVERHLDPELVLQVAQLEAHLVVLARRRHRLGLRPRGRAQYTHRVREDGCYT